MYTIQKGLNILNGTTGLTIQRCINSLAGTSGLTIQQAWNVYAGTTGKTIQQAANIKNGTTNLTVQQCVNSLAAGGVPFSPSDISGLKTWVKADVRTNVKNYLASAARWGLTI